VPALVFPLKAAVWKKVRRVLKSVARAFVESRMLRAQIEIDRYHRMQAHTARIRLSRKPITGLLARSTKV
jgi:hypothetical protein